MDSMKAGLYTYAWDLEAEGFDRAAGRIAEAGFTAVNLATSYHAGKFILPHNPKRKLYVAQDGSLYFQPDLTSYGRIQPRVNSLVSADDSPVTRLQEVARTHGLEYVAWVVCLHNSWIGEQYPDVTAQTAFGDSLFHSLSPAHPDVREYMVAMIGDLVSRHEVSAIELESPGYMGFHHDHHHIMYGVVVDPVQSELLGVSFNSAEVTGATEAGIDVEGLRRRIAGLVDACWNEGKAVEVDGAPSVEAKAVLDDPELAAYRAWQHDQVVSLSAEIQQMIKERSGVTEIRHFAAMAAGEGGVIDAPLMATGDAVLAGYAATPEDVAPRMAALESLDTPTWGMIRAIQPEVTDPAQIEPLVSAWRDAGVTGVDVYNYGLMPERTFRALGEALNR
jgi:hypothetical protein